MYLGLQITNEHEGFSYFICAFDKWSSRLAVVDVHQLEDPNNDNIRKPKIWTFDTFNRYKSCKGTITSRFVMPIELSMTDTEILSKRNQKWLDDRERRLKNISSFLNEEMVREYLFGEGISENITKAIEQGGSWKSQGAYYNAFNKYIVYGCVENAFLPFGYKHCGSKYHHVKLPTDKNIKRGCHGGKLDKSSKAKQKVVSKHRGITDFDKRNMYKLYQYFKKHNLRYKQAYAFKVFQREFEVEVITEETENDPTERVIVLPQEQCISKSMFYRHWRIIIGNETLMHLKYGDVAYEKDWKPRFEKAREGVIGPSYRYEIDATILDIYVRYSYDESKRLSVGRPVVYFVVDVYTTMITGYYIGFHGPDWIGAAEAMVHACLPKEEHCAKYGVILKKGEWPCYNIPFQITADNGTEYSLNHLAPVLQAAIGLRTVNFVPVYRGDCKGIVERRFGIVQDMTINFEPGATIDLKREDQHPSNKAVYDLDALHQIIIRDIIHHNNTSKRTYLLNKRDAKKGVGITPRDLWLSNINEEMNGGNPVITDQDKMHVRWAFLLKGKASIRDGCIHFQGLRYDSDYAYKQKWYIRAKSHGAFQVDVGWTRATANFIIFRTDDGSYVELVLKDDDHCERFSNEHWDMIFHRQYHELQQEGELAQVEKVERIQKERELKKLRARQMEAMQGVPKNTRKSMQPGVRGRQQVQKQLDMLSVGEKILKDFSSINKPVTPKSKRIDNTAESDKSLYDAE